jgi:hypothetical protein
MTVVRITTSPSNATYHLTVWADLPGTILCPNRGGIPMNAEDLRARQLTRWSEPINTGFEPGNPGLVF